MKAKLFLFVALAFIAGCQSKNKSVVIHQKQPVAQQELAFKSDASPANSANPYDSVGRLHNESLEAVHQYIQAGGDTSEFAIKGFIGAYFNKYRHVNVIESLLNIPDKLPQLLFQDYRKVILAHRMAPRTTAFLIQLFDSISTTESLDYRSFKSKIVAIEKDILAEHRLSVEDKRMLLCTASLARYSGHYWSDVLDSDAYQTLRGKGLLHFLKRAVAFICCCIGDASGAFYAYLIEPEAIIADASFLSTATWGGMTYYGNW